MEKEGLLYVGGYPQPFAKLDLKVKRIHASHLPLYGIISCVAIPLLP